MVALSPAGKDRLDRYVKNIIDEKKIPGFVFGATSIDEEIYFNAGGYNVVNDPKSGEVVPDSIFWICSQTKLIVHVAALQLLDQGRISLDSAVSDFFPEFANLVIVDDQMAEHLTFKPAKKVMTFKHLLNFSSGLYYPMKESKPDELYGPYSAPHSEKNPASEFLSLVKNGLPGIPILFEPGESFAYGYSSDILGFIVEKISGQSLEQYLQENIFKPLEIKASFYLTPDIKDKLVDLSFRRNGKLEPSAKQAKLVLIEQDPTKVRLHLGGVGLYSTLQGYLSLLRHLLQIKAGKAKNAILSGKAVESLFEGALTESGVKVLSDMSVAVDPYSPRDFMQWSTGLGVTSTDWPGKRKKGSAFWGGWANTNYFIDPTTGVAVVFGTQLVPLFDNEVLKHYAGLETVLYAGLT